MLAPDLVYIVELLLYINGFRDTKQLAGKVIQLHALCCEQLSSVGHYEFNIRTIKSIVKLAKSIRRDSNNNNNGDSGNVAMTMSEQEIILKACRTVNRSKMIAKDFERFNDLCEQTFGQQINADANTNDNDIESKRFDAILDRCLEKRKLNVTTSIRQKIQQIYGMLTIRSGIICVGDTMTGKTIAWQLLADVLKEMPSNIAGKVNEVAHRIINPKSISLEQLYGQYDCVTREWCAGALEMVFAEMLMATGAQNQSHGWIIFDGIIDPLWIERLHTLLDDNRKLCLASGQIIERTPPLTFVFETNDVTFASPATIARCGIVHFERDAEQWRCVHLSFVQGLQAMGIIDIYVNLYGCLVEWLIPAILSILIDCPAILSVSPMQQYSVDICIYVLWTFL